MIGHDRSLEERPALEPRVRRDTLSANLGCGRERREVAALSSSRVRRTREYQPIELT